MKKLLFILFCCISLSAAEAVLQADFDTEASCGVWSRAAGMSWRPGEGRNGGGALRFDSSDPEGCRHAGVFLDIDEVRGRGVVLEAWIRAENVSSSDVVFHGPKLMLVITGKNGKVYPDQPKEYGSYDWKKFTAFARVPQDAESVRVVIGIEEVTGTLWFDDLRVTLGPQQAVWPVVPNGLPVPEKTRYRGVMSGYDLSEEAFRELGEVWNANLLRYQIIHRKGDDYSTVEGFRKLIEARLHELDAVLPRARKHGIRLVLDMHVSPDSHVTGQISNELSYAPEMQQELIDTWRRIAARYRNEPAIYGYDLLNEPLESRYVPKPGGGVCWNELARKIALAIREVDSETPVIVQGAPWGGADALEDFVPLGVPKVIYSFHFYGPAVYTHQGIGFRPFGGEYPGVYGGEYWDRARLEKAMSAVIEFQKKYRVPIYVGEFGVVRWAPNGEQWLEDMISIFEKYGWDWTFHAFREWDGWSAEHSSDIKDSNRIGDTSRRRALLRYMRKNTR